MPLDLDFDMLLPADDAFDDRPPEVVITPAKKSNGGRESRQPETRNEEPDYYLKTDEELKTSISSMKRTISMVARNLADKGEKLKANLRQCEAELERRNRNRKDKGGMKYEAATQLHETEKSFIGASYGKDRSDHEDFSSPDFVKIFNKKLDENKNTRTVNAFQEELTFFKLGQGRNTKQSSQHSSRARSRQQSSSKTKPFHWPNSPLFDTKKQKISNVDQKVNRSTTSSHHSVTNKWDSFSKVTVDHSKISQDQTSTKPKHKLQSFYHLVDEDEDEDECLLINKNPIAEKLSECMKDVKVYYPSRDDCDAVEVIYTDMKCLDPKTCLSSTIMNFYIRYLQQLTSSEDTICKHHFFSTYFYNKLQHLEYGEDSFLKFRKWWKRINLFEKAYIFLPIHESAHWSLVIICIPSKEDKSGPIVLHMDSLTLHDSKSIFDNIKRFVKEEWSFLQNSEDDSDLSIKDENWENVDCRIRDRRLQVPRQTNTYDCGLFVLFYMERFIKEAPERLKEKDLSMFSREWFDPEEASNLRVSINNLLVQEFKIAKDKETVLSPMC